MSDHPTIVTREKRMNWKIEQLRSHMVEWDVCDDYAIFVPGEGRVIIAEDTSEDDPRYRRRQVEQLEFHDDPDYPVTLVMENDYDNPIHNFDNIKFEIHEAVYVIG
jgi:hypothetical protein